MADWKKIASQDKDKPDRKLYDTMIIVMRSCAALIEAWNRFQRLHATLKAEGYEYTGTKLDQQQLRIATDLNDWSTALLAECVLMEIELQPKIESPGPPTHPTGKQKK